MEKFRLLAVVAFITVALLGAARTASWGGSYQTLYTSRNLGDYIVNPECNPGGGTECEGCSSEDVEIKVEPTYGLVTSNKNKENIWVNAIGGKLFIETFPDDSPISLGTYRYLYQIRLPLTPFPDVNQEDNPEGMHLVIILWDGRDALFQTDGYSVEAGIYWSVNPWNEANYGKIQIWTSADPIVLIETGITVEPDTEWHTFELIADFINQKYISITIDGETKNLDTVDLPRVAHPDWGNEVALIITAESMSAWPSADCSSVFTWTTHFKDVEFSAYREITTTTALVSSTTTTESGQTTTTLDSYTSSTASTSTTATTVSPTTTILPVTTTPSTTTASSSTTTTILCPAEVIYGGCSEEIERIRDFRTVLNMSPEGRAIIKIYYQWSAVIVMMIQDDEEFKEELKELIDEFLLLIGEGVE
jgi:hypothetical protein